MHSPPGLLEKGPRLTLEQACRSRLLSLKHSWSLWFIHDMLMRLVRLRIEKRAFGVCLHARNILLEYRHELRFLHKHHHLDVQFVSNNGCAQRIVYDSFFSSTPSYPYYARLLPECFAPSVTPNSSVASAAHETPSSGGLGPVLPPLLKMSDVAHESPEVLLMGRDPKSLSIYGAASDLWRLGMLVLGSFVFHGVPIELLVGRDYTNEAREICAQFADGGARMHRFVALCLLNEWLGNGRLPLDEQIPNVSGQPLMLVAKSLLDRGTMCLGPSALQQLGCLLPEHKHFLKLILCWSPAGRLSFFSQRQQQHHNLTYHHLLSHPMFSLATGSRHSFKQLSPNAPSTLSTFNDIEGCSGRGPAIFQRKTVLKCSSQPSIAHSSLWALEKRESVPDAIDEFQILITNTNQGDQQTLTAVESLLECAQCIREMHDSVGFCVCGFVVCSRECQDQFSVQTLQSHCA